MNYSHAVIRLKGRRRFNGRIAQIEEFTHTTRKHARGKIDFLLNLYIFNHKENRLFVKLILIRTFVGIFIVFFSWNEFNSMISAQVVYFNNFS